MRVRSALDDRFISLPHGGALSHATVVLHLTIAHPLQLLISADEGPFNTLHYCKGLFNGRLNGSVLLGRVEEQVRV
jgi:hypothetical protein